ncbi:MAG: MATE family efflux transporter [Ruminococcaceae bacterium]|nr:MATE family efflux transporter [Oscillospiraceae bacterium]
MRKEKQTIKLSDHFTYGRLLKFTLPSIVMMIFSSIYGVVDGFFVSNFAGKTAFTAVNFIFPLLMILGTVGFMFGTGGSALVARTLGEKDWEKANSIFSLLVYVSLGLGVLIAAGGILLLRPLARLMGAEGQMLEDCVLYGRIILCALPAFVLQMEFQSFFVTAEKPKLGLAVTVASGVTNMVLDGVLVGIFRGGLVGAAAATAISQLVGGVIPLIYFGRKNGSLLRLGKARFDGRALWKTCANGSSELMSNVSMSLVSMLYNIQLLNLAGEDGVSAYGTMMYVNMIFLAIFIGYSIGTAPVVGFHLGAENYGELRSLLKKSAVIVGSCSVAMLGLGFLLARPLSVLFVGYDDALCRLTVHGFYIFAVSFLFVGFAIFFSGFFTALNDGLTSAVISFLRTLVFQIAAVLLLPLIWGIDGIWWSIVVAELMAALVGALFLVIKRKKFRYF